MRAQTASEDPWKIADSIEFVDKIGYTGIVEIYI